MAAIAKALGDPIRLQLVDVLRKHAGKVCVCELTPLFDVGQPTVSHHLKMLRDAGIVDSERQGLWAYYYVNPEALEELTTWLTRLNRPDEIREAVRERYADAARTTSNCCGPSAARIAAPSSPEHEREVFGTARTQTRTETRCPRRAKIVSLGCGNPTALAELHAGETVLDLGSGGGIDVLLSARRVGPTGFAYGLDMTDEMLALARKNAAEAGRRERRVPQGHIEEIPLPTTRST